MKRIFVIGAGGHGKVIIDIARLNSYEVVGLLDDASPVGTVLCGIPVLGACQDLPRLVVEYDTRWGVVAIGDNATRAQVVRQVANGIPDFQFCTLVHPSAVLACEVQLGAGSVVMAGAVINPGCKIGTHAIINTMASVDHDSRLGDYVSVAPGATLGGNVHIGNFSVIGQGANVIHGIHMDEESVLGACSLLNKDLPDHVLAYGIPARVIRARKAGDRYL